MLSEPHAASCTCLHLHAPRCLPAHPCLWVFHSILILRRPTCRSGICPRTRLPLRRGLTSRFTTHWWTYRATSTTCAPPHLLLLPRTRCFRGFPARFFGRTLDSSYSVVPPSRCRAWRAHTCAHLPPSLPYQPLLISHHALPHTRCTARLRLMRITAPLHTTPSPPHASIIS